MAWYISCRVSPSRPDRMSSKLSFTVPCSSGSQPKMDAAASMTSRSPVDQWDCERRSGNRIPTLGVMYEFTQLSGRSANADAWTSRKTAARCCGPRAAAIERGDTGGPVEGDSVDGESVDWGHRVGGDPYCLAPGGPWTSRRADTKKAPHGGSAFGQQLDNGAWILGALGSLASPCCPCTA